MSGHARHERAVAQSCQLAQGAADVGNFEDALGWLKAVEMVDGPLAPEWDAKRALWLRQGHNGTPRTVASRLRWRPKDAEGGRR